MENKNNGETEKIILIKKKPLLISQLRTKTPIFHIPMQEKKQAMHDNQHNFCSRYHGISYDKYTQ